MACREGEKARHVTNVMRLAALRMGERCRSDRTAVEEASMVWLLNLDLWKPAVALLSQVLVWMTPA